MKSWNGPEEDASLIAPPRRPAGDGIRIRALLATFTTCAAIFGLDALFPGLKSTLPPAWNKGWRTPTGSGYDSKPFEWSQVCEERFLQCDARYMHEGG
jgi:hypothetical protein